MLSAVIDSGPIRPFHQVLLGIYQSYVDSPNERVLEELTGRSRYYYYCDDTASADQTRRQIRILLSFHCSALETKHSFKPTHLLLLAVLFCLHGDFCIEIRGDKRQNMARVFNKMQFLGEYANKSCGGQKRSKWQSYWLSNKSLESWRMSVSNNRIWGDDLNKTKNAAKVKTKKWRVKDDKLPFRFVIGRMSYASTFSSSSKRFSLIINQKKK